MNQSPDYINITLRLPRELHVWLKHSAAEARRSMSAQTLLILEHARDRQQSDAPRAKGGRRHG